MEKQKQYLFRIFRKKHHSGKMLQANVIWNEQQQQKILSSQFMKIQSKISRKNIGYITMHYSDDTKHVTVYHIKLL